jgi:hypothetical protein
LGGKAYGKGHHGEKKEAFFHGDISLIKSINMNYGDKNRKKANDANGKSRVFRDGIF